MEEAKQQGHEAKLKSSLSSSVYPEGSVEKEKKGKKSWKSCLSSWWKKSDDKKSKVKEEEEHKNSKSKVSGKRHVSGPIHNLYNGLDEKHRLITLSGPLTNLFKGTKREENEIPYMSLHQQNSTNNAVQNYGPLYVVT